VFYTAVLVTPHPCDILSAATRNTTDPIFKRCRLSEIALTFSGDVSHHLVEAAVFFT